jgi:hypothetical protein
MVGGSLRVLPGTSTTKTGRHDIAEILLKVGSKHQKSIKINLILAIVLSAFYELSDYLFDIFKVFLLISHT